MFYLVYDPRNRPSHTVPVNVKECNQLMLSGGPSRAVPVGVMENSHTPADVRVPWIRERTPRSHQSMYPSMSRIASSAVTSPIERKTTMTRNMTKSRRKV